VARVTMTIFLGLVAANMLVYFVHFRRYPIDRSRKTFALSRPTRLYRWAQVALYLGVIAHLVEHGIRPHTSSMVRLCVGSALGAVGVLLQQWALATLGANFAACFDGLIPYQRIRSGPYRWMRHPLYVGNMSLAIGILTASFDPFILSLVIALAVFYGFSMRDENRMLDERFPGG
jgi:protein-S-isoprenylcysteine O-methyltransferase Ste14